MLLCLFLLIKIVSFICYLQLFARVEGSGRRALPREQLLKRSNCSSPPQWEKEQQPTAWVYSRIHQSEGFARYSQTAAQRTVLFEKSVLLDYHERRKNDFWRSVERLLDKCVLCFQMKTIYSLFLYSEPDPGDSGCVKAWVTFLCLHLVFSVSLTSWEETRKLRPPFSFTLKKIRLKKSNARWDGNLIHHPYVFHQ